MTCRGCFSERTANVQGKTSDLCFFSAGNIQHQGYVPGDVGVGEGGDYIRIDYCLDCGRIQGDFPIPQEAVDTIRKEQVY